MRTNIVPQSLLMACFGLSLAGTAATRTFIPVQERSQNPKFGRNSSWVTVFKGPVLGQATQWQIANSSGWDLVAVACRHFDSGGGAGRQVTRTFASYRLKPSQTLNLDMLPNNDRNYYELAWFDAAASSPPVNLTPPESGLVIYRNPSGLRMVLNAHTRKSVEVETQLRPGGARETNKLGPSESWPVGFSGGVDRARYTNPYVMNGDIPCSTFPDGQELRMSAGRARKDRRSPFSR